MTDRSTPDRNHPKPTFSPEDVAGRAFPSRRTFLIGAGALGATGALGIAAVGAGSGSADASTATASGGDCSIRTSVTEGPYWVDEKIERSDVTADVDGTDLQSGVPLALTLTVLDETCTTPLSGIQVDIWHANAQGQYSDEQAGMGQTSSTVGQNWLRGYQLTDANGQVTFSTIWPGWYSGRTIHIHARFRTYNGTTEASDFVTQIFFDESVNATVLATSAYTRGQTRDTYNSTDSVYSQEGSAGGVILLPVAGSTSAGYAGSFSLPLALAAPTTSTSATATTTPTTSVTPTTTPTETTSAGGSTTSTATATPTSTTSTTSTSAPNTVQASLTSILARTLQHKRVVRMGIKAYEKVEVSTSFYNAKKKAWVSAGSFSVKAGKAVHTVAIPSSIPAGKGYVRVRLTDTQGAYKVTTSTVTIPVKR